MMKNILLFLFVFVFGDIYSQESINSSGGNATGTGGSASYSVGQMVYSGYSGLGGNVNEGVQQPFEIFILSNENFESLNTIFLYPNPTSSLLYLSFIGANEELKYSLINITGIILLQDKISQINTTINMENFPEGVYFLTISATNDLKSKSFKIIKK